MKVKIAVVQFEMQTWQITSNLDKMEKFIAKADKSKIFFQFSTLIAAMPVLAG